MRFGVLGPVTVQHEGVATEVAPGMVRTVLAVLLLHANAAVSVEQLVEALWGDNPPVSAIASLTNHVMRARRLLPGGGHERIRAVAPGYLIRVEPGELDLQVFDDLCATGTAAARTGQWASASADLAAALALWRGPLAAGVPSLAGLDARIAQALESRVQALEHRIEADLRLGRHAEVLEELRQLVVEHPLREVFYGQLMVALYRSGRRADALAVVQGLRRTLVGELGVEPSPSVQLLHCQILNSDLEFVAPANDPVVAAAAVPPGGPDTAAADQTGTGQTAIIYAGPRFQLPADTRVFTGRSREVDELVDLAGAAPQGTEAGMVVISAIDGMAGIGKSALAVHAAHRVRGCFPDGQLFLDLHGYTTGLDPMDPGDALDWLLRSLGTPPDLVPHDLGERAASYRDRLDGTRTLIILDNASSGAQVRPLLPGTPGCLVLVTSRRRLTGLEDAHALTLDVLPEEDAVALLHTVAGAGRIPSHHPAVLELVALCGNMPLAIRITASRLRLHQALRIEDVVAQLRDETARLENLQDEDEDRDLTAVFDLSHQDLSGAERQLFHRLSLIPGPDFDAYAAANLTGTGHRTAERLLESLLNHNLLTQHTLGRYRFHDLIRLYARTRSEREPTLDRDAAWTRLLDYYQHTAQIADGILTHHTRPAPHQTCARPVAVPDLPDRKTALAWILSERGNLLAAISQTASTTRPAADTQPSRAVALTSAIAAFLQLEGPWPQAAALHQTAATTAHEHGDRLGEANALYDLGRIGLVTRDLKAAAGLEERALAIYRELGEQQGEANALWELGRVLEGSGDLEAAESILQRALVLYLDLGDRRGEANAIHALGRLRHATGDHVAARSLQEQSLAMFRETGDRQGEASVVFALGRSFVETGDAAAGGVLLEEALAIYRQIDSRHGEASALWGMSRVRHLTGDFASAAGLLEQALVIYQDLGHRRNEAYALLGLGRVGYETGDFAAAAGFLDRGLPIFQSVGDRSGEATTLHALGRVRHATGNLTSAATLLELALVIAREINEPQCEAEVLNSTGALLSETTGPREALDVYLQALDVARKMHNPLQEARALDGAAKCAALTGDRDAALTDLCEAVAIYQRISAPEAAAAAERLAELDKPEQSVG